MNVAEIPSSAAVLERPDSQAEPADRAAELEQEAAEFICRQVLERGANLFDG